MLNHAKLKTQLTIELTTEQDTQSFAVSLAKLIDSNLVIFLSGPLGAGKTTLVRYILAALGITERIKSPTYTIVEPYTLSKLGKVVYHFDLYRLACAEELELLGVREYFNDETISLIEWPQNGKGVLPEADLELTFSLDNRRRKLTIEANTLQGIKLLTDL